MIMIMMMMIMIIYKSLISLNIILFEKLLQKLLFRYLFSVSLTSDSRHVRESKTVLDPGFHAVDSRFQVLDFTLFQWNLDSGFQSFVGFRIPWAVFRIPKFRIPDSTSKSFLDSVFRNPDYLMWGDLIKHNSLGYLPFTLKSPLNIYSV